MGWFGHNQLLLTSQVSLCTSDSGATVYYIVSYLIGLVITLKTDYLIDNWVIWHTLVLSRVGIQGDRPLNILLVVNVRLAQYGSLQ